MSVYFLSDGNGRIKIGHAKDPSARLKELQCGSASELRLMRVVPGGQRTERWFHVLFKDFRIGREWFCFSEKMVLVDAPPESLRQIQPRSPSPRSGTIADYLQNADKLGILTADMRAYFAPLLKEATAK